VDKEKQADLEAKNDVYLALKNDVVKDEDIRAGLTEFLEDKLEWVFRYKLIDTIRKIWNPDYQRPYLPTTAPTKPAPREPGAAAPDRPIRPEEVTGEAPRPAEDDGGAPRFAPRTLAAVQAFVRQMPTG
jgi:hypothetical protein